MIGTEIVHAFDDGREVRVTLPDGYDPDGPLLPVVVCNDPQWTYGTARDVCLNLSMARQMPKVVVVGVGWETSGIREVVRRRAGAYTPTPGEFPPRSVPAGDPPEAGGAAAHLEWIRSTVLADLESRYRIDPTDRTVVGHSFSALFGLFTLVTRPDSFRRYLLASPSVWWNDRVILGIVADELPRHADVHADVFVSVGADEEDTLPFPMVTNARLAHDLLAEHRPPSLHLHPLAVLDGEDHYSTVATAIGRGLRTLFAQP